MSDLFGKLNNFVESYQKATNPIFDVLPGGQILNAPTSYVLDQIGRHNADRTDYLNREPDPGTGKLEPTIKERILLGGDADAVVQQTTKKQLSRKYGKDSKRFGYKLTDEEGNTRLPSAVKADSDFYAMPEAREAVARGLSLDPSMDTAQSIARKTQRKDLEQAVTDLDPSFSVTGISDSKLRAQLRQLQRSDKYGSLTTGADGKPRGSAQLEQDVVTEAEGNRLRQQTDIEGKAKYGSRYGQGKGTAELANELALERQVAELENQFNSKGAKYDRYRDQRNFARDTFIADRAYNRGVFESDRSFNRNTFENDRNFAQRVLENNNALDMRKFELEMQRDMSEDARQYEMINNLMGGLFSLGSLL